jgi:hypothetical protein
MSQQAEAEAQTGPERVTNPWIQFGTTTMPIDEKLIATSAVPASRSAMRQYVMPNLGMGAPNFGKTGKSTWPSGYVGPSGDPFYNTKKGYVGYLQGSRPPTSLDYVRTYFIPDGPFAVSAVPLTQASYDRFLKLMFQSFQQGLIPGQVSYDPPSFEDVKTILLSDPQTQNLMTKIPHGKDRHVYLAEPEVLGLPTSKFRPTSSRRAMATRDDQPALRQDGYSPLKLAQVPIQL